MKNQIIRTFALAACTALFSAVSLQASIQRVSYASIPFDFEVTKGKMPAGKYRIEQEFGTEVVTFVNMETGQRARALRPASLRAMRSKVEFVRVKDVPVLKIH